MLDVVWLIVRMMCGFIAITVLAILAFFLLSVLYAVIHGFVDMLFKGEH